MLDRGTLFEKLRQDLKERLKVEANHESIQTLVEARDRKIATDKAITVEQTIDSLKNGTILKIKMGPHLCNLMVVWFKHEKIKWKEVRNGAFLEIKTGHKQVSRTKKWYISDMLVFLTLDGVLRLS